MTREDAKAILEDCLYKAEYKHGAYGIALKMAIKALEQEPCEDWYDVPSNEMTLEQARQAVTDLRKKLAEYLWQEPCDEYGNYRYPSDIELTEPNTATSMPCGDAISRQAVLDTLDNMDNVLDEDRTIENYKELLKECYEVLPSVNPTKTGHWEQYGNYWEDKFKCSECGKEQPKILNGERIIGHWSDYCPNCGAKMVDEQEI